MNFKELTAVRERVIPATLAEQKKIDALGPRRRKAEALLAEQEKALSDAKLSTDIGVNIECDLEALRNERKRELGLAHADGRKANTEKIDASIKTRERERAAYLDKLEGATAATKIIEGRVAEARVHLKDEVDAINKLASAGYAAIASLKQELAIAAVKYGINVSVSAGVSEVVGQHFDPLDYRTRRSSSIRDAALDTFKNREYHLHAEPLRDDESIREMEADELQRLASLGLPANNERRVESYLGPAQFAPGYRPRTHGIYDDAGRQVG
jgi:hypothetical protein